MNTEQKVIIRQHPTTGELFTQSENNPEFYKCMLETSSLVVNGGIVGEQKLVAFPAISAKAIKHFTNLKNGDEFPIPGRLVINEYFDTDEGYREGMVAKINPNTNEDYLVDGKQVFREVVFTTDLNVKNSLKYSTSQQVSNISEPQVTEELGKELVDK